jgi:hypothetical protein
MDTITLTAVTALVLTATFLLYVLVRFHQELVRRAPWRSTSALDPWRGSGLTPIGFSEEDHDDQKSERWLQSIIREGQELGWTVQE